MRESIVSFLIETTDQIQTQVKQLGENVKQLNSSIEKLTKHLTNTVVDVSENLQSIIHLIQSSRDAQFNVVFSMFSKHMEALEEIRDIALNFSDDQKAISEEAYKALNLLRRKMLDYEFQTFIFNLQEIVEELKRMGV